MKNQFSFLKLKIPIFILILNSLLSINATGQSIQLTSPLTNQNLKAGDDFFTDILGAPADGSSRRMIGWEENFVGTSVRVENGIWKGTNQSQGAYVFPLFPGLKNTLITDSLPGDKGLPKFGSKYPIQASKYNYFSYRLNHSSPSTLAIYWDNDLNQSQWWPRPRLNFAARADNLNTGWNIRHFNMLNLSSDFPGNGNHGGAWSSNIHVLRLDPSAFSPTGSQVQFDWIRLVDPNSAPLITITWNSTGFSANQEFIVYQSNTNSGYNGTPLARITGQSTYTFPSAALPPGNHHFYIEARTPTNSIIRSAYSARITIKAKPEIIITSPAPDSGDSYSLIARNKEWDMSPSGNDIYNLRPEFSQVFRQFIFPSYSPNSNAQLSGHVFQAMAEPPYRHLGNTESDVQLHFEIPSNKPIDPNHYRYIVYRMAVGEAGYPTISDKVRNGWVSRVIAWNNTPSHSFSESRAHVVYEGWNTYWFDQHNPNTLESGQPWDTFSTIRNLRLDPGEFTLSTPTWFFLDYFKIMSENRTKDNLYKVNFNIKGNPSDRYTVEIFYDNDNKGFNGTRLTTLTNIAPGSHSYIWNTSALPNEKNYFVYIVVNDEVQTSRKYSSVHIKTGEYVSALTNKGNKFKSFDFTGDGFDDHPVYRPSLGTWFTKTSQGAHSIFPWGNSSFFPFRGDFDGDGTVDAGLMTILGGFYHYYVRLSSGGLYAASWGLSGDYVVIGDYNGNGRDQVAVWRPSEGNWYILNENGTADIIQWGLPGDVPVPGDFNGNGKTDPAIWRPSTGTWWLRNGVSTNNMNPIGQQWGLPGDIPISSWYGADNKAKFLVWRPFDGTWYLNDLVAGISIQQWGLPGDVPLCTDHNADERSDFTVYRNGIWFNNFRNGTIKATNWGLPGDRLPLKVFFVE